MIVPELVKVPETMGDLEEFFDGWMRTVGWANIAGFNHGAGQREDRSVMQMAPPGRVACGRLWSRCMVLADGKVIRCDQDYIGRQAIGDLAAQPLSEIWPGARMTQLRAAHRDALWDQADLCGNCTDWHRP